MSLGYRIKKSLVCGFLSIITALAFAAPAHATPVLGGFGLINAEQGSFGQTGSIAEYLVRSTPGLTWSMAYDQGLEYARLTYTSTVAVAGHYAMWAFLDADIDMGTSWFDERGAAHFRSGGADAWEIDEPGYAGVGDIYDNFQVGALDQTIFNGRPDMVEDVALALGFSPGQMKAGDLITWEIMFSEVALGQEWGTTLQHWDVNKGPGLETLYFAGRYSMTPGTPPSTTPESIPEPSSVLLAGLGLFALVFMRRRA